MMLGFLVGAVAGGVAVWLYRERIQVAMGERSTGVRARAADTLETLQHRAESAMDRAKDKIATGLRAGQDYLRTAGTKAENGPPDTLP
jgi:hypothetical protein